LNIAAREGKLDGCILDEKLDNKSEQIHSKWVVMVLNIIITAIQPIFKTGIVYL
jgi:hypothetical protein